MHLIKKSDQLQHVLSSQSTICFVPTMGALHEGHISLIEAARQKDGFVVSSIFVNPTQFNEKSDYDKYPITLEEDIEKLVNVCCDCLFLPDVEEMYPGGLPVNEHYDLGYLETILEGYYRPGHFQGVCMVVKRLLEKVNPDYLFLGQKDYQQCMVIKKLIELMGANDKINLEIVPTLREKNGLAMSSRNRRLSEHGKEKAAWLYKTLKNIEQEVVEGDLTFLKIESEKKLIAEGFRVDYIEIADAKTLEPVAHWDGRQKLVALVAAFLEEVRLIDNITLQTGE